MDDLRFNLVTNHSSLFLQQNRCAQSHSHSFAFNIQQYNTRFWCVKEQRTSRSIPQRSPLASKILTYFTFQIQNRPLPIAKLCKLYNLGLINRDLLQISKHLRYKTVIVSIKHTSRTK